MRRRRHRQRHAAGLLRRRRPRPLAAASALAAELGVATTATSTPTSATPAPSARSVPRLRARHLPGDPRGGAALPRLGRPRPATRFRRQRARARSTCSKPRASTAPRRVFIFTSTNKVYGDSPNRLPLIEQDTRWEIDPQHPLRRAASTRTCPSTSRCTALFGASKVAADVHGAGVRALLRPADRVLPRRLPDRSRTTSAANCTGSCAYLMKCVLTGTPYTVFGYQRQAGARQHPQRRPDRRLRPRSSRRRAPARSTTSAAAATAIARCSKRSRSASEIAGRQLRWTYSDDNRIGRSHLVGQRPVEVPRALSRLGGHARCGGHLPRHPRRRRGALDEASGRRSTGSGICVNAPRATCWVFPSPPSTTTPPSHASSGPPASGVQ